MIRKSSSTLRLEVSQPSRLKENGVKNHYGSLLSVAKVLRVYLENGQTRSFSYDSNTTVQDILDNLTEKLHIRLCAHFALAVEQSISLAPARLSLLLNNRRIESLAISPLSSRLRCRLRIAFPPVDLVAYSVDDPIGFDYFYQQCVNDFVDGRLVEMRYEASLRLAALHIRQVCMENSILKRLPPIRRIEKEYGLATFLPTSWLEKVRPKDINGHLEFFLRKDQETFAELENYICQPRQRRSATDGHSKSVIRTDPTNPSAKLTDIVSLSDIPRILRIKYVKIVSLLPAFGLKCFSVNYKPTNVDIILQVDTRCGISVRYPGNRDCPPAMTVTFSMLASIYTYPNSDDESTSCLCLQLQKTTANGSPRNLEFIIDRYEIDDLVAFVMGSANLYASRRLNYFESCPAKEDTAPPFHGYHLVQAAGWNYVDVEEHSKHVVDLRSGPPSFGHAITTTYTTHQENQVPVISSAIAQDNSSLPFDDIQRLNKEASEITVEPVDKPRYSVSSSRRRSSQQKFVQMLGTASAIINRNRSHTKRIRDSLRIHRQR
ncbi:hypothetical protein M3Y98_00304000 [Aphelenchoides besseyi]|nr:hypothetical protein M3Y98_00304000 [Aphelenchoides besseyi]